MIAQGFVLSPYYGNLSELKNREAGVGQSIYIGQYGDASGLDYLNARYYNAAQGQFLSQDPSFLAIGDPQKLKNLIGLDQSQVRLDFRRFHFLGIGFNSRSGLQSAY